MKSWSHGHVIAMKMIHQLTIRYLFQLCTAVCECFRVSKWSLKKTNGRGLKDRQPSLKERITIMEKEYPQIIPSWALTSQVYTEKEIKVAERGFEVFQAILHMSDGAGFLENKSVLLHLPKTLYWLPKAHKTIPEFLSEVSKSFHYLVLLSFISCHFSSAADAPNCRTFY